MLSLLKTIIPIYTNDVPKTLNSIQVSSYINN